MVASEMRGADAEGLLRRTVTGQRELGMHTNGRSPARRETNNMPVKQTRLSVHSNTLPGVFLRVGGGHVRARGAATGLVQPGRRCSSATGAPARNGCSTPTVHRCKK
ncbi:hypothetical protein NDU88_000647 [Pleurodeles waltl]|uniref:Uncharacterized protein n=1 Tax=Pleurodeles waltl TaxID=8319 RepID=A0AAV7L787_PLEWA|nr:hypothetical protein NDU88_000647 [Pleurodeles waltl]